MVMRDFTPNAYRQYLEAIRGSFSSILRFDEYFVANPKPTSFCLIRHDVDRRPENALAMATIEEELNVRATYYFRAKRGSFRPRIISAISGMGHEIGYHYECLSDANGDIDRALADFERNLRQLRQLAPVCTVSMHGRPLSRFDSRDLWRDTARHRLLTEEFGILGEVYLDIGYADIAYVTDTGRNWDSDRSNRRDRVSSDIRVAFASGERLLRYLETPAHSRLVFLTHPERWSETFPSWVRQYLADFCVNCAKRLLT